MTVPVWATVPDETADLLCSGRVLAHPASARSAAAGSSARAKKVFIGFIPFVVPLKPRTRAGGVMFRRFGDGKTDDEPSTGGRASTTLAGTNTRGIDNGEARSHRPHHARDQHVQPGSDRHGGVPRQRFLSRQRDPG